MEKLKISQDLKNAAEKYLAEVDYLTKLLDNQHSLHVIQRQHMNVKHYREVFEATYAKEVEQDEEDQSKLHKNQKVIDFSGAVRIRVFNGMLYQKTFYSESTATKYCLEQSKYGRGVWHFNLPNGGFVRYRDGDLCASYYPEKKESE